jgi:tRNA A-37 threonylcarbamoyl transferase component Bud32
METANLSSAAQVMPLGRVLRSLRAPHQPLDTETARGTFDGRIWVYRNGFENVLAAAPGVAWTNPAGQGWQRVKRNARREVWRAKLNGSAYYLKYYFGDGWAMRVRRLFRGDACEVEWKGGIYALQTAIPAVAPAAYTTDLIKDGAACSLLVTEAAEPAYPLDEFWEQVAADNDGPRRRRDTAQAVRALAQMIARAHQAGFEHLDMHAANILVQPLAPRRYRTLFVDLQSARRGAPLSDRAVVRNLAQLNQWFRRRSNITTRLRFLRAYLRYRDEYEHAFEHGRPLGFSFRGLWQALVAAAHRHAEALGAQRDRRARRAGQYFARLRVGGGWRGLAVIRTKRISADSLASRLVLTPAWWRQQLSDPLRWFRDGQTDSCKESHSACVRRGLLQLDHQSLPVIFKRPRARNWRRRLSRLLTASRSRRGWRMGQALLNRHIPTARPLAMLERRYGPLTLDSILITEAIPGACDLGTWLRRAHAADDAELWRTSKQQIANLLAKQLRRLAERGFVHRDCKAGNVLVISQPQLRLLWIDMDGLRRSRRRSEAQQLRALAALHVSLLNVPGLNRSDRVRFLKSYTARFGADPRAWQALWRRLDPLIQARIRTKTAHRLWKLKHYGRE